MYTFGETSGWIAVSVLLILTAILILILPGIVQRVIVGKTTVTGMGKSF